MSRYVQLHTHSHYSFLRALPKIPELVARAKKHGMPALGLTDAGNLHGAISFYKECEKAGIKPVIGVHTYIAPGSHKDPHEHDHEPARIILIARNLTGYTNIIKLVTTSFLEGFWEHPRIDHDLLKKHADGITAILPAHESEVSRLLAQGDKESAAALLAQYRELFGTHLYQELTHHPEIPDHDTAMHGLAALAHAQHIPLVAGQEVYYLDPDDREAREVLMRIREGRHREDTMMDLSFKDPKTIEQAFADIPEAISNTQKIADEVDISFDLGKWVFPNLDIKEDSYEEALRNRTREGLIWRGLDPDDPVVQERTEYELDVIITKGFAPYFLVVSDLLTYAKDHNILTTTRGSAAGSLVSYATGITNIDPIAFKLPFERFLNPERPKAPDIDMDFADTRRDEVIQYAREKYGDDKVAQIGTFGTMMARAAVRDTARALGYSYNVGDRIAKLIPMGSQGFPMTIDKALELEPDLKKLYKGDEDAQEILDLAQKIEGCARHTGVHAAGVVIAPTPLYEWTPVQRDPKGGKLITQYDMHSVEDAGLLKFDFLGIKNLSILADSVARAKEETGDEIDIENIPLDDKKTFAMLARGETEGLFQLNGSGMTKFLKDLKPSTIHDINAMVALYRPGPMESIPTYIERKHNPDLITYPDERMKEILSQSHGVITYQDDVLLTAITLAGYSWLEADKLRKAMGKKIPEEMEAQKEKFLSGCEENGMSKEKAKHIWSLIAPFAGYGFNKAHAASYGKVAYQTAYMKANYPVPYMAALLTADSGDTEKISELVAECNRMNIPVLPPSINDSETTFTIVEDGSKIRFGLGSIKNFGSGIADAILEERTTNGPFTSINDFLARLATTALNRKGLEALIRSGALDELSSRGVLLKNIENLLTFQKESAREARAQDSLFGSTLPEHRLDLEDAPDPDLKEKLLWEKELLGIYISGHPLDAYKDKLAKVKTSIEDVLTKVRTGHPVVLACMVEDVRVILTKKGDKMAFVRIMDPSGSIECVTFPDAYKATSDLLQPASCIVLKGTLSGRNDEKSIIVEKVKSL